MKVAIAFACLMALASARSALKLREGGDARVTAGDGLEMIKTAKEFTQKVRGPLRNIQETALDLLSGSVSEDQAKADFDKAEGELGALDEESKKLQEGMGDKLEQLKEHGVKDRSVCVDIGKHMCGSVKYIVENDPAETDPVWKGLLKAVAGSLECLAGKFDAFEDYLGSLKAQIEDAVAGRKKRELPVELEKIMELIADGEITLEDIENFDLSDLEDFSGPLPTGLPGKRPPRPPKKIGKMGGRPRPTGMRRHPKPSGEENEKRDRGDFSGPMPTGFSGEMRPHRESGEHSGDRSGPRRAGRKSDEDFSGPMPTGEMRHRHHSGERRHPKPQGSESEEEEKRSDPSAQEVRQNGYFMMEVEAKAASVQLIMKHLHGNVERFLSCLAPLKENKRSQHLRDLMQKVRALNSELEYARRYLH